MSKNPGLHRRGLPHPHRCHVRLIEIPWAISTQLDALQLLSVLTG